LTRKEYISGDDKSKLKSGLVPRLLVESHLEDKCLVKLFAHLMKWLVKAHLAKYFSAKFLMEKNSVDQNYVGNLMVTRLG
jgi:hypothetical protein